MTTCARLRAPTSIRLATTAARRRSAPSTARGLLRLSAVRTFILSSGRRRAAPEVSLEDDIETAAVENAALRRQVEGLETQLVAYDAVLDGNARLAQSIAPGVFEVRRKHAVERVPVALLREAFPLPSNLGRDHDSDDAFLRRLWTGENRVLPRRIFVSCPLIDGAATSVSVASASRAQAEPGGVRVLTRAHTNIPRGSDLGLPTGFTWLVTSWSIELRNTAGWHCGDELPGEVEFTYDQERIADRPLSDVLRPQNTDVFCVMRQDIYYAIIMTPTRGLSVRPVDPAAVPDREPRLYVFLDVIAREPSW